MNRIPNQLTAVQKIVLMMLSASLIKDEPRYAQGAGFVHEGRSVWLTYYFSAPHTEDELEQKAVELGLANDLDWLYYLVEKYEKKVRFKPTQLWRELLYK